MTNSLSIRHLLLASLLVIGALVWAGLPSAHGAEENPGPDFQREIWPIFTSRCVKCHGAKQPKGGLRLDDGRSALAGGDSGAAIAPGKPAESYLLERVSSTDATDRMPPEGEALSAEQIDKLKAWIAAGAKWPGSDGPSAAEVHWSLRPITRPVVPATADPVRSRNPIDLFVQARLATSGLTMSPEADRRTLIRRLAMDLVGLPPTPEEVDAFTVDRDEQAYEKLVERLLASPRHGERWAQHWLDAVRFAESDGFETNKPRANSWPYRDWVIEALNVDKPYDRFVLEQLAGDVLGADRATGFLVGGANDVVKSPDPVLTAQQRADVLHDMVSTTTSAFVGLTVGCARCHNHKFDPIPQVDYYAIKAALAGVDHGERPLPVAGQKEGEVDLAAFRERLAEIDRRLLRWEPLANPTRTNESPANRPAVHPRLNVERFAPVIARRLRMTVHKTNTVEPCIDELEVFTADDPPRNVALATAGTKARASSVFPNSAKHKLEHLNDGQVGNSRSWISAEHGRGWVELEFAEPVRIEAVRWGRDREEQYADRLPLEYTIEVAAGESDWQVVATAADRQPFVAGRKFAAAVDPAALSRDGQAIIRPLLEERAKLEAQLLKVTAVPKVYAGVFSGSPAETKRFHRGDPMQPRDAVPPGGLRTIPVSFSLALPSPAEKFVNEKSLTEDQRRRLALGRWIVDPANPLTARVIVNRLWQHHFGEGLVSTSSDFGANGARPTHPELLDWLARELLEHGWSLRHVHRLIVNSATYRQSSRAQADALVIDAQSRLLWRYPPRRLQAEPLRDSILAASGKLDLRMGGPGFLPFEPNDNYVRLYNPKQTFGPEDWRRMIYMTKIRMQQDGTFGAFDCPDGGQIAPRRSESITPLQALNLLNSPFLIQQAEFLAKRVEADTDAAAEAQVRRTFRLVLLREPAADELVAGTKVVRDHGLTALCRALFNCNEFVFVD